MSSDGIDHEKHAKHAVLSTPRNFTSGRGCSELRAFLCALRVRVFLRVSAGRWTQRERRRRRRDGIRDRRRHARRISSASQQRNKYPIQARTSAPRTRLSRVSMRPFNPARTCGHACADTEFDTCECVSTEDPANRTRQANNSTSRTHAICCRHWFARLRNACVTCPSLATRFVHNMRRLSDERRVRIWDRSITLRQPWHGDTIVSMQSDWILLIQSKSFDDNTDHSDCVIVDIDSNPMARYRLECGNAKCWYQ